MTEVKTEIELKYDVPTSYAMPPLDSALPGVSSVETTTMEMEAMYFDTADLRLARRKMTLRRRTGGSDQGWHLKLPVGKGERTELHEPWTDDLQVPDTLLRLVGATTRGAELVPVARLRTTRHAHRLADADGRVLVEVADDSVVGEKLGEAVEVSQWREVEVELVDGERAQLEALGEVLVTAGAAISGSGSKLARTLGVSAKRDKVDLTDRNVTAGRLVLAYLVKQREALLATDPGVRLDRPDAVHKMRVASRRLRSALKTFDRLFEGDAHVVLEDALKRLAEVLGAQRDAEVLLGRVRAALDTLPAELVMGPVRHDVDSWMGDTLFAAREATLGYLDSADYVELLEQLEAFLDAPPLSDNASLPARKEVTALVDKTVTKVRHRGRGALATDPGEPRTLALHDARRAAKRSRYAADVLAPYDPKGAQAVSLQMENLQETLGEWHDGAVLAGVLRDLAARTGASGGNGFTYGYLLAHEETRGQTAERDFALALKHIRPLKR
jgi:CHAD domain-containing protein